MMRYDMYDLLTFREREQITDLLSEAAARDDILLHVWEPIVAIETS